MPGKSSGMYQTVAPNVCVCEVPEGETALASLAVAKSGQTPSMHTALTGGGELGGAPGDGSGGGEKGFITCGGKGGRGGQRLGGSGCLGGGEGGEGGGRGRNGLTMSSRRLMERRLPMTCWYWKKVIGENGGKGAGGVPGLGGGGETSGACGG